jgi:hypothetical protein
MIFILFLPFLSALSGSNLLKFISSSFVGLHESCLNRIPVDDAFSINSSLLCGQSLNDFEIKNLFLQSGLIHALILGQSQLLLIEALLRKLKPSWQPRTLLTVSLSFSILLLVLSSWPAPLLRTFLVLAWRLLNELGVLFIPETMILIFSVSVALILNPEWLHSLSLLHSAGCGAAALLARRLFPQQNLFLLWFWSSLLTFPFLWGWGQLDFVSLIIGTLLGHFIAGYLFLCALVTGLTPHLGVWLSLLTQNILRALPYVTESVAETPGPGHEIKLPLLWSYLGGLVLLAHFIKLKARQNNSR